MTTHNARARRFGLAAAVVLGSACAQESLQPATPPVVFPPGPIEIAPGRAIQILVQIESAWEVPQQSNGTTCIAVDSTIFAASIHCLITAVATSGTGTVVVDRNGATTDIQLSIASYPKFNLPQQIPRYFGLEFFRVGPGGIGYATGVNDGNAALWRFDIGSLSAGSPRLVTAPGLAAVAIDATGSRAYIAGFGGGYLPAPGTVPILVIDLQTDSVVDTIVVLTGRVFTALLAPGDSLLYVGTDGHLTAVDVRTKSIRADLPVGDAQVSAIVWDEARHLLYATISGNFAAGVVELDPATLAVRRTIVTPDYSPSRFLLSDDGARLFVIVGGFRMLSCSLGAGGVCTPFPSLCGPEDISMNSAGSALYLGCGEMILVLDPATLHLERTIVAVGLGRLTTRTGVTSTLALGEGGVTLLP